MALVDTTAKQEAFEIADTKQLIRILQGAVSDENGASTSYDRIIDSIKKADCYREPVVMETVVRLEHIRDEEYMHIGNLVTIITNLSDRISELMEQGSGGD